MCISSCNRPRTALSSDLSFTDNISSLIYQSEIGCYWPCGCRRVYIYSQIRFVSIGRPYYNPDGCLVCYGISINSLCYPNTNSIVTCPQSQGRGHPRNVNKGGTVSVCTSSTSGGSNNYKSRGSRPNWGRTPPPGLK